MRAIDCHTHVYHSPEIDVETSLRTYDVESILWTYVDRLNDAGIEHAIAILLDEQFLDDEDAMEALLRVRDKSQKFTPVFTVDPRESGAIQKIDRIADISGLGVKFHCYLQDLGTADIEASEATLERINEQNLLTIVDSNFAGEKMYEVNGVEFGHAIAQRIDSPVLLAHAGNVKILEAFATARAFDNVWLGSSFTMPYFEGSSIGQDFAFAMEKMEMDQWVWGSDRPYNDIVWSRDGMIEFVESNDLEEYKQDLFYNNIIDLCDRVGIEL